jgi:anti-anti-sigma factor
MLNDTMQIGASLLTGAPNEDFGIAEHRDERSVTVAACGELDMSTSPHLKEAIDRPLNTGEEIEELVLDLSEVTFCDSTGVALVVRATRAAHAENVPFTIAPPRSAEANRVFEVSGMDDVLPFDATEKRDGLPGATSRSDGFVGGVGSRR